MILDYHDIIKRKFRKVTGVQISFLFLKIITVSIVVVYGNRGV